METRGVCFFKEAVFYLNAAQSPGDMGACDLAGGPRPQAAAVQLMPPLSRLPLLPSLLLRLKGRGAAPPVMAMHWFCDG